MQTLLRLITFIQKVLVSHKNLEEMSTILADRQHGGVVFFLVQIGLFSVRSFRRHHYHHRLALSHHLR